MWRPYMMNPPIILASTSPRRQELLQRLGIPFEVRAPRFEEISDPSLAPDEEAVAFAVAKALSLQRDFPKALLIGSDTLIACSGEKLGKPKDPCDAHAMLRRLAGRSHEIFTGLAVCDVSSGRVESRLSRVLVTMKTATEAQIAAYVAAGESLDKAGAYAIQGKGRELIAAVEGDLDAAVGLPLRELAGLLRGFGVKIPE